MHTHPNAVRAMAPPAASGSGTSHLVRGIASARTWLRAWQRERADRLRLSRCLELDPRFARDIGLTHTEIAMPARRPTWVPNAYPNRF